MKSRQPKSPKRSLRTPRSIAPVDDRLLTDVCELIEAARQEVAQTVNSALVASYWHIGRRIRHDVVGEGRATYGEQIVNSLSSQLTAEYGQGFNRPNLFRMIRFADAFPNENIVADMNK
jgi:hypothetical protein